MTFSFKFRPLKYGTVHLFAAEITSAGSLLLFYLSEDLVTN